MMREIKISEIEKNSIAEELEIEPGDLLVSINNKFPEDIFDYYYLINDEVINVEIKKPSGEIWEIEIEKEMDEALGLVFEEGLLDEPKSCRNKCVFCFIDQLPKGMRNTLYFKDDDTRLSFMHGNYVTLTNMKDEEIQRIIDYRIQPINISVHSTDPKLRMEMLNNKNAGKIMEYIKRFASHGMTMNAQVVLCPEINDGEHLKKTLKDLAAFYPYVQTVSVVPVGITKYRQKLSNLRQFTISECNDVLDTIQNIRTTMKQTHGTGFVFPSDEFFLRGKAAIPDTSYYEEFTQLENGVGMLSLFKKQFIDEAERAVCDDKFEKRISVATGELAYPHIVELTGKLMGKVPGLKIRVHKIANEFFGDKITVSGLITGRDLITQLKAYKNESVVLVPENMLKHDEDVFLDDITLEDVEKALEAKVFSVKVDGKEFLYKLMEK
jgi:putative radical SAM enzyme (TIGR03279 family)